MTIIIAGVIIILGISFGIGILFKNNGTITLTTCAAALVTFGIFVAMQPASSLDIRYIKYGNRARPEKQHWLKQPRTVKSKSRKPKQKWKRPANRPKQTVSLAKASGSILNRWNRNGSKPSKRHRTRSSTCRPKLPSPSQKAPEWHRKHRNKE